MKAAIYTRYGSPEVVSIQDILTPQIKDTELLIKLEATTVSTGDVRARSLSVPKGFGIFARPVFGFFSPKKPILGTEFSGSVVQVGSKVTRFKVGDQVFGFTGFAMGCHVQFKTMSEDEQIAHMPTNLNFNEAAALCFGGTTALYFLKDLGKVKAGDSILIIGGSGAVGSAAIQIAKSMGCHITGVTSGKNLELVRSLGCEAVIDYTSPDPYQGSKKYDAIFDTVGAGGYSQYQQYLTQHGKFMQSGANLAQLIEGFRSSSKNGHQVFAGTPPKSLDNLLFLKSLAERGLYKPLIDQVFQFDQIVKAHRRVDSGRKKGSVVISMKAN